MRIAQENLAEADLPVAFKRAVGGTGPDPDREQLALLHKARKSLLKSRQHLLNGRVLVGKCGKLHSFARIRESVGDDGSMVPATWHLVRVDFSRVRDYRVNASQVSGRT